MFQMTHSILTFLKDGGVSGGINPLDTARTNSWRLRLARAVVCIITAFGVRKYGLAIISDNFSVTSSNSF